MMVNIDVSRQFEKNMDNTNVAVAYLVVELLRIVESRLGHVAKSVLEDAAVKAAGEGQTGAAGVLADWSIEAGKSI